MRTNIEIDDRLLAQAMKITGAKTKRAAVQEALRRVVNTAKARDAFARLEGVGWEGDLKAMRRVRRF